ncbi:MAG: SLBB domain-containing protein [Chitinivibrionales bacterium]|nr:SLBB domain-containing protein [Chitinivibrionales bacterium]
MKSIRSSFLLLCLTALAALPAIIKVGNTLSITVQGHAELSGSFTVGETGQIDYSAVGDEPVANVTTSELARTITFRIAKYVDNPLVTVAILDKPEITVTLLGQVARAGPLKTYLGVTVQEVIQAAGGPTAMADVERIKIIHKNGTNESAVFFNMKQFLVNGNIDSVPRMQADDVVILLSQERTQKVKVIGGVAHPGFYDLQEKMTIFEVIYLAGGPAEKADLSRVRRFSLQNGKTVEEVLDIQSYIDKGQMDNIPTVQAGDMVIVYSKWFDWKTMLSILTDTLLLLVTIKAFGGFI